MDLKLFATDELETLLAITRNPLLAGGNDAPGREAAALEREILSEVSERKGDSAPWQSLLRALKK
jgi:hypothetical protein